MISSDSSATSPGATTEPPDPTGGPVPAHRRKGGDGPPGYLTAHQRVRLHRGAARSHPCRHCGGQPCVSFSPDRAEGVVWRR